MSLNVLLCNNMLYYPVPACGVMANEKNYNL